MAKKILYYLCIPFEILVQMYFSLAFFTSVVDIYNDKAERVELDTIFADIFSAYPVRFSPS